MEGSRIPHLWGGRFFPPQICTADPFSPGFHFIYVPFIHLGYLRKTMCFRWGSVCCLPPWKGPVWNEELSNFPDLVVGNPQWWVSGNKIKWLETQTWVPIVPEAKNASQAGFSRQLVLGWGGCWLLHAFIVLKPAHLPETPPFGPSSVLSWPSPL